MKRLRALLMSLSLGLSLLAPMAVLAGSGDIATDKCVKVAVGIGGQDCIDNTGNGAIVTYLQLFLKFLSGGIGLVIVLMIVIGGVQYITSAGDPSLVKKAKERIVNALTALMLFILAYAILNFLIPGGIFG